MVELAVVAEELGRAAAPGPWAGTAVVGAVVAECGSPTQAKEILPGPGRRDAARLAGRARRTTRTVRPCRGPGLIGRPADDGSLTVDGAIGPVPNGAVVARVLAPVEVAGSVRWALIERDGSVRVGRQGQLRSVPALGGLGARADVVPSDRIIEGAGSERIRELALLVASAEAVGGARWCLDSAAEHARTRHQFGRPIGQFQGVKHRLADMLVSVEQGVAATWDAAVSLDAERPGRGGSSDGDPVTVHAGRQSRLAVQLAASLALDGYVEAAKGAIQVLGGMGFTWEHDAHIHLRRATTLRQLIGGTAPLRAEAAGLALAGHRRPPLRRATPRGRAAPGRAHRVVAAIAGIADPLEQRRALAEEGLLVPALARTVGT